MLAKYHLIKQRRVDALPTSLLCFLQNTYAMAFTVPQTGDAGVQEVSKLLHIEGSLMVKDNEVLEFFGGVISRGNVYFQAYPD